MEYAILSRTEAKRNWRDGGDTEKLKQTFNTQTLFVNTYWDIATGTPLTPYLGAGLGIGIINTKLRYSGENADSYWRADTGSRTVCNFAWNAGAGVGYNMTENWTLDLGYRFVGLGSVKSKTYSTPGVEAYGKAKNLYQHQLALGMRYTF